MNKSIFKLSLSIIVAGIVVLAIHCSGLLLTLKYHSANCFYRYDMRSDFNNMPGIMSCRDRGMAEDAVSDIIAASKSKATGKQITPVIKIITAKFANNRGRLWVLYDESKVSSPSSEELVEILLKRNNNKWEAIDYKWI